MAAENIEFRRQVQDLSKRCDTLTEINSNSLDPESAKKFKELKENEKDREKLLSHHM